MICDNISVNEKGRLTVVMDGLEKGRYDIFMENEKIGQAKKPVLWSW